MIAVKEKKNQILALNSPQKVDMPLKQTKYEELWLQSNKGIKFWL